VTPLENSVLTRITLSEDDFGGHGVTEVIGSAALQPTLTTAITSTHSSLTISDKGR